MSATGPLASSAPARIHRVDDHDEVYEKWKALGLQNEVLLHLDEHSDFQWLNEDSPLRQLEKNFENPADLKRASALRGHMHLGNYLARVFQEGMASVWYWAVPDPFWKTPALQRFIWNQLADLYAQRTGPMTPPRLEGRHFRTSLWKTEVWVGSLDDFPGFGRDVILNIDLDFMTAEKNARPPRPETYRWRKAWIWPDELAEKLQAKKIVFKTAELSNSINGAYTPLRCKFFGQALENLLQGLPAPDGYAEMKTAAGLLEKGEKEKAREILSSFQAEGALEAARLFDLALLAFEDGRLIEARLHFEKAQALDPDYATLYACLGPVYENCGLAEEALEEYLFLETMKSPAPDLVLAKARTIAGHKKPGLALPFYEKYLEQNPGHAPSHFAIGSICLEKKETWRARTAFKKTLELDPAHGRAHLEMGRFYFREKRFEKARMHLREALRAGLHLPGLYRLLAAAYARTGNSYKAWELGLEAARLEILRLKSDLKRRLRRAAIVWGLREA